MKMLVVFVLAVLGCSLAEGRLVSKCELRDKLNSATANLTVSAKPKGLSVENLVFKLVCQAEQASGFNTSAVNQLDTHQSGKKDGHTGEQTEDHGKSSEEDDDRSGEKKGRSKSHRSRRHDNKPAPPAPPAQNCTLYGVFQLSSCQVCNDSVTPSANICGTDCSNFLDDNIQDDISCLLMIAFSPGNCPIAEKKCKDGKASVYFSECPSP